VIDAGLERGEEMMRTTGRRVSWAALCVFGLVAVPMPSGAVELSGGVGLGGILAGTVPRLAVSPNAGVSWRMKSGFLFAVHDLFSILPPINKDGAGVDNQTSVAIGYASEKSNFSVGPSLSIYSMPACGVTWCGRVVGLSPGGHGQANVYFAGPWGVSVSANVGWVGGRSLVLPGGVAAMIVAGPVFRWSAK
jgi:hypothetical protein